MNKYLLIMVSFWLVIMSACQDHDTDVVPVWKQKNLYRVKEIAGTNEAWGNFRLECGYVNEKLDSIVRYDEKGKIMGRLMTSYYGNSADFYWYDYVVSVDADSVAKLDSDSIPYALQLAVHWNYQLSEDKIKQEIVTTYGVKELPVGADFDYTYELKGEIKYLYEYGEDSRPLYLRVLNLYNGDEMPAKYEFLYEQDRKAGYLEYKYETASWLPYRKVVYEWADDQVKSINEFLEEEGWNLIGKQEFTYQGTLPVRLTTSAGNTDYGYNSNDCLSEIQSKNAKVKVTYESGNGNFSWLKMPERLFSAAPSIE